MNAAAKTGWPAPALAQDDSHPLFRWFASKPDARLRVRDAVNDLMVQEARLALEAYGLGDRAKYDTHRLNARAIADALGLSARTDATCPSCEVVYMKPQECDWCPNVFAVQEGARA